MKKLLLIAFWFTVGLHIQVTAQNQKLSDALQGTMSATANQPAKKFPIVIFLKQQVDYTNLHQTFITNQIPVSQRPRLVIRAGMEMANQTQGALITSLKQGGASNIEAHWLVNAIACESERSLIFAIIQNQDVAYIKLQAEMQAEMPDIVIEQSSPEAINGTEPGLRAIRAPFMWNLGYTGRNRRAYIYDSGISASHPAVRRQFLGNRFPISQAWLSSSIRPADADGNSNHGSHVTGTVLGLNPAQNDTIGVAFNGYFIANDYVGGSSGTLIQAFQFALNPDGDTSTVDDVVDVVNNSWRYTTTSNCNPTAEINAFNALDAAGIAVVFAAGNSGPNAGTISFPAAVVIDSLAVFSVGNLNGSQSTFPINSGSSRGPTPCSTDPILRIKPEVSAPGTSIRSSVFANSFSNLSGTSMAAPHVSGAVLLLKEAFPELSGRQILNALYQSATDLGTPGKDNVYGRGIINLQNAYNFLSAQFTPTPPVSLTHDLSIDIATFEQAGSLTLCENPFTGNLPSGIWAGNASVTLRNRGQQPINGFRITSTNKGVSYTKNYTQTINVNGQLTVLLDSIWLEVGNNEPILQANFLNATPEADFINNNYRITAKVLPSRMAPTSDNFMNAGLIEGRFSIVSNDGTTWYNDLANGLTSTRRAMIMPMINYLPRIRQRDELYTSSYVISNISPNSTDNLILWNMAYKNKGTTFRDSLLVDISCDCGNTWQTFYRTGGDSMQTYSSGTAPALATDWRSVFITAADLPSNCYGPNKSIQLRFVTTNDNGGNLYLTNLTVLNSLSLQTSQLQANFQLKAYPNPSSSHVFFEIEGHLAPKQVQILDLQGRILHQTNWATAYMHGLDVSALQAGLYIIEFIGDNHRQTLKFIKQ